MTAAHLIALSLTAAALAAGEPDALAGLKAGHPRLLFDAAAETARIGRLKAGTAPQLAALLDGLRRHAADLLAAQPPARVLKGYRLLDVSRDLLDRTLTLGALWRLTGDAAARDRLRADLLAVAAFTDWNPAHFLDVAEMTAGVALGYDWLFDQLTDDERGRLATAIRDLGLKAGDDEKAWWVASDINWNQVCHGGLVLGALAIADREPDLARRILDRARRHHARALEVYEPEGVYPEGPGYWSYGTEYSVLMDQALVSAAGLDWGLWRRAGFVRSFAFLRQAAGPTSRMVNYADGNDKAVLPVCAAWAAQRLGDPALAVWAWERQTAAPTTKGRFAGLLALVDEPAVDAPRPPVPATAWVGRGAAQIACLRSTWGDPAAVFVALKAGRLRINHGHLDAGSVILEAGGQRFAEEFGKDDQIYARRDAWGLDNGGKRWEFLRVNNRGHNVLVLGDRLQDVDGDNPIGPPIVCEGFQGVIADLGAAYRGQAASARRGVALVDGRAIVIQDEFTGIVGATGARWLLHTRAQAEVAASGQAVILTLPPAVLHLRALAAPTGARFTIEDPIVMPDGQAPATGWRRVVLTVPAPAPDPLHLTVVADVRGDSTVVVKPLDAWAQ